MDLTLTVTLLTLSVLVTATNGFFYLGCVGNSCEHSCVPGLLGSECTCNPGYSINKDDSNKCDKVPQCADNNVCAQRCIDLSIGSRCSCDAGFEVSANDNTRCDAVEQCRTPLDIVFVIDSCSRLGQENYNKILAFVSKFSQRFQVGNSKARFGAYIFADKVQKLFGLSDHKTSAEVSHEILTAPFLGTEGSTNTALEYFAQNDVFSTPAGGRSNAANNMVLILDGLSENSDRATVAVNTLRNFKVQVTAIGIGETVSQDGILSVSSDQNNAFVVASVEGLDYIEQRLARLLCPGRV